MKYADIEWRDGQPVNTRYDDIYFSSEGGREESTYVFLAQNDLPQAWRDRQRFVITETGFGTGLNFILTVQAWLQTTDDNACLHYVAIEKHPVSPLDMQRLASVWPDLAGLFDALLDVYPLPVQGVHYRTLFGGRVRLHLLFMDIQQAFARSLADTGFNSDAWYLDGFGPAKNPDIWAPSVFRHIAGCSHVGSTLATYTCAGHVRRGLQAAGFEVRKLAGFGSKREMMRAELNKAVSGATSTPWYERPEPMAGTRQATVLGAGIAGLTAARALVQRGWRVRLVDRHDAVAGEASGNPAGLVLPRLSASETSDAAFYAAAFLYAVDQLKRLQGESDQAFWFGNGVLSLDRPGRLDELIARFDYPAGYLRSAQVEECPPSLAAASSDVHYLPLAGWVVPGKLCRALLDACGDALDYAQADITDIEYKDNRWWLLDAQGRAIANSSVLVLANGTGVAKYQATAWLPVTAVRGQVTMIAASDSSRGLQHAVSFDNYVTPAIDGWHCAGASFSRENQATALLQQDQDETLAGLERLLPGMFEAPARLQGRVGFRAVSSDRVPLVGAMPDVAAFRTDYRELHHGRPRAVYPRARYLHGLYVSAAHGSRGLCSGFLSAEIVAAMINGEPLPVCKSVADHLAPARILLRQLRRAPRD